MKEWIPTESFTLAPANKGRAFSFLLMIEPEKGNCS
jgi:hypothetical protein